jgi:hypothetical protein
MSVCLSHISNIICLKFRKLKVDSCSYSVAPLYAGWFWRHAINYICLILKWRPVGVAVWMYVQFSKHKNLSLPRLKNEYLVCTMYVRADFYCRSYNKYSAHILVRLWTEYVVRTRSWVVLLVGTSKTRRLFHLVFPLLSDTPLSVTSQIRISVFYIWRSVWQIFCTTPNGEAII